MTNTVSSTPTDKKQAKSKNKIKLGYAPLIVLLITLVVSIGLILGIIYTLQQASDINTDIDTFEPVTNDGTSAEVNHVNNCSRPVSNSKYRNTTTFLTHHWQINGQDLRDKVGNAHLETGANSGYSFDLNENPSSALSLQDGFMVFPELINYFGNNCKFTFMFWIQPKAAITDHVAFEFSNSPNDFYLIQYNTGERLSVFISFKNGQHQLFLTLKPNEWSHITITNNLNKNFLSNMVYINGGVAYERKHNVSGFSINCTSRMFNFIGKSKWVMSEKANANFDDIKIFEKVLTLNEVLDIFYNTLPNYKCPNGWLLMHDKCYYFYNSFKNSIDAEDRCAGHDAKLVTVQDKSEFEFLKKLYKYSPAAIPVNENQVENLCKNKKNSDEFDASKIDQNDCSYLFWEGQVVDACFRNLPCSTLTRFVCELPTQSCN